MKKIIADFYARPLKQIIAREVDIPLNTGKVVTLMGARRSGKTFQLYDLMHQLLDSGHQKEKILYLNFEDERLDPSFELDDILRAYQELFPHFDLRECWFFFDEIQNIGGWEKFIRRLHDTVSEHVFVTGSNSSLLSRDIATALRGRTLTYEIFPLNWTEFLTFNQVDIFPETSQGKAQMLRLFQHFFSQGGFPELVFLDSSLHAKVLQEYFNTMLFRDLIERYDISQVTILKYFCKRLVGNSALELSINKIYHELKSQGYKISKNVLYDFQDYAEAIYLSPFLMKYDPSVVKQELAQKKVYSIDTGMVQALDFKFAQDQGRQLETLVYLELRKQGKEIFYVKNGFECDFVSMDRGQVEAAFQVSYEMKDEATREREIKGMVLTCQKFGLSQGHILTMNQQEQIEQQGITISVKPVWEYFLRRGE